MPAFSSGGATSAAAAAAAASDGLVAQLSRYCGLTSQSINLSLIAASALPAIGTLCIIQVPTLSSRLRRTPFAVLSLLLLAAACHRLAALWSGKESWHAVPASNMPELGIIQSSGHNPAAAAAAAATAELQHQQQHSREGDHAKPAGSLTMAVMPILLALLLVQAPGAAGGRRRRSHAGLVAVLGAGLLLHTAAVDAAVSMCAAEKPVCTVQAVPVSVSSVKQPATTKEVATGAIRPGSPAASPFSSPYADALLAAMGVRKEALHVASNPVTDSDVPQRVMPVAPNPMLSKAYEQQLFTQLIVALTQGVPNATAQKPRAKSPAPFVSTASTSQAAPDEDGLMYMSNSRLRVGIDTRRGGAITHLSSPVLPEEWANINLINTWDSGRLIQQSYYGCEDGSCWSRRAWRWNPVQGGSWHNYSPRLLSSSSFGGVMSTSAMPRNWGSQSLLEDVVMTTQTRLLPNMLKVRFTMQYTGSAGHPPRHQEVPAVFLDRRLNALAIYTGPAPWTGGQLSFLMPGQVNEYYKPTERWAAYVDTKSGFGVGIYTPIAEQLVAYRVGPENSTARSDCSYMAPLVTSAIEPNSEFSYDTYIAVGRVDEMRQWFAALAATEQPVLTAQRRLMPASNARYAANSLQAAGGAEDESNKRIAFTPSLPAGDDGRLIIDTFKPAGGSKVRPVMMSAKAVAPWAIPVELPQLLAPMVVKPTPVKPKVSVGR